jgi:hypothetical protein
VVKHIRGFLTVVAPVLSLTGCVSWDTPYQPTGLRGGYEDTAMGDEMYQVVFRGNGFSGDIQAREFALMRGAELCKGKGFTHLAVMSTDLRHEPLSYYDSTTYSMVEVGEAPVATVVVHCLKAEAEGSEPVTDVIARVKNANAENMPK